MELFCGAFFSLILIPNGELPCPTRPALLRQILEGDLLTAAQATHRAPPVSAAGGSLGLLASALRGILLVPKILLFPGQFFQ
jgi:hypothetical protein